MRRRIRLLILILLAAACVAGCAQSPVVPPKVVQTTVTRFVPLPEPLTAPCVIAMPRANTVREAVRVARERRAALQKCNAQLEEIRNLAR